MAAPARTSGLLARIDAVQRRRAPLAFPLAVVRKFSDDKAGRLAATIAYYGFFSLFPAMLALVTVLGFVLQGRDDLRDDIQNSALGQFPVVGEFISSASEQPLTGNTTALIIGLATALWAGMGATQAAQSAMNDLWQVPRVEQPGFLAKRLRSLIMLLVIGGLLVGSALVAQTIAALGGVTLIARLSLVLANVVLNTIVFAVAFQVLTVGKRPWPVLLPGAIVGGIGYQILQVVGAFYIDRVLKGAQDAYGTFAVVIGLLTWLHLHAQLMLLAAEINVVKSKTLWPRHLTPKLDPPQN